VIAVCTPKFKERSDERGGCVGYEGDIITAYVLTGGNNRKFIPVLRRGNWTESAPDWLLGRAHIDLSNDPYSESAYEELLRALHGVRQEAPPIGPRPNFGDKKRSQTSSALREPPRNRHFSGRAELLEELGKSLETDTVIALLGIPGVGKTQHAIEYINNTRKAYGRIYWLNASSREQLILNQA
jgi:hypothetical protein